MYKRASEHGGPLAIQANVLPGAQVFFMPCKSRRNEKKNEKKEKKKRERERGFFDVDVAEQYCPCAVGSRSSIRL